MPIYTYQCPRCGVSVDKLRKVSDTSKVFCECQDQDDTAAVQMEQVPATPSPMQWGCRKGF